MLTLGRALLCALICLLVARAGTSPASAREADTSPPAVSEFDFTPKTVDVSTGEKQITVSVRLTDATGAEAPLLVVDSDSTTQTAGFGPMVRTSGDAKDGVYSRTVTMPTTAAPGSWTVRLYPASDSLGNTDSTFRDHPTKLTVTNGTAAPAAPSNVTATKGDKSAVVSWTAPTNNGGSPITGYTITSTPGGITKTVDGSTTTGTITGLTNGTSYTFTVAATNATGTSPASAPSNVVTPSAPAEPEPEPEPVTAPAAPTDATAKVKKRNVVLAWSAPEAGDAPTGYRVASNKGYEKTLPAGTTKLVVRKLKPGKYTFFIASENEAGISDPVRLRVRVR